MNTILFWELVLYGVPMEFGDEEFTTLLRRNYKDVISSKRILQFPHKEPTTLIRVRISSLETQRRILATGCNLGNYWFRAQLKKNRYNLRRCYKCQRITDHLARNCPHEVRCVKCSKPHSFENCDAIVETCANCGGPHRANSTSCPHWLSNNQPRPQRSLVDHHRMETFLERIESTMKDRFSDIMNQIISVRTEIEVLKSCIAPAVPPLPDSRFPLPNPDQPSGQDEDPQDAASAESSQSPDPHCSPEPMDQHSPEKDNDVPEATSALRSAYDECTVNNVNTRQNQNVTVCRDTNYVNSDLVEKSGSPEGERVNRCNENGQGNQPTELTETMEQNTPNPYMGKILFRYTEGSISNSITIQSVNGVVNVVYPCKTLMNGISRKLRTRYIDCCPYHHLAAAIRDSIVTKRISGRPCKKEALLSLKNWRTKDTSAYSSRWSGEPNR